MARLWAVVLVANLVGTAAFAAAAAWTPAFSPEVQAAFLTIGHDALSPAWGETFVRAIGAAECLFVVFKGEATISAYVVRFLASSFLGNSIGGVALVASLAHARARAVAVGPVLGCRPEVVSRVRPGNRRPGVTIDVSHLTER